MAAGAPGRVAGANAHQQTGNDQRGIPGVDLYGRQIREQQPYGRRTDQANEKRYTPQYVGTHRSEQPTQNAADTCYTAVEQKEAGRRKADQNAAREGSARCELAPGNINHLQAPMEWLVLE